MLIFSDEINSLINNLDFRTDLIRYSVPMSNVTASKRFESLFVDNLLCANGGRIQDVDIADWVAGSALTVGNYTIQGITVMESPSIFGDVR